MFILKEKIASIDEKYVYKHIEETFEVKYSKWYNNSTSNSKIVLFSCTYSYTAKCKFMVKAEFITQQLEVSIFHKNEHNDHTLIKKKRGLLSLIFLHLIK